jgi:hypothetical protein
MRAMMLKEDANARAGISPEPPPAFVAREVKLDRQLRLRAIRRMQTQKAADAAPKPEPKKRRAPKKK